LADPAGQIARLRQKKPRRGNRGFLPGRVQPPFYGDASQRLRRPVVIVVNDPAGPLMYADIESDGCHDQPARTDKINSLPKLMLVLQRVV